MDKEKYTTMTVSKQLKRRLDAIAASNRRTVPQQIEYWCDQATAETQAAADCLDQPKSTTDLK